MSYVLNPKTNRMIKVGGKPWRTLVKEGLIANDPITPQAVETSEKSYDLFETQNEIYEAEVDEKRPPQISTRKDNIRNSGNQNILPLKQRDARIKVKPQPKKGHYVQKRNGRPVQIKKGGRQEDIADYTAQCASRTLHKHIDVLSQQLQDAYDASGEVGDLNNETLSQFEGNLKNLILEEMLTGEARKEPNRYMNDNLRQAVPQRSQAAKKAPVNYETDYEVDPEYDETDRSQYEEQKFEYY